MGATVQPKKIRSRENADALLRALAREAGHVGQKSSPLKKKALDSWKIPLSDHVGRELSLFPRESFKWIASYLFLSVIFSVFFMNKVRSIHSKKLSDALGEDEYAKCIIEKYLESMYILFRKNNFWLLFGII